ncbi:hypothetical protein [uncultured Formosa sp.]|uniref:hypothetical protein n=1 Tax=uncultured Formosa sp. TaxID=255435 RepID=UPI00261378A7|nr:hypothetical protein [uncultured Formosa sp.]
MNTGTIILSVVFIIICALPFILSTRNSRKRKNDMLKALKALAEIKQASITKHEAGSDFVIGLDEPKNMVFFFKKNKEKTIKASLDLSDYKECRTLKFGKNLNSKSKSHAIDTLKLEFIPKDKTVTESQFEFYNEDINIQLSGELQIINTWQPLIQQRIAALN